MSQSDFQEQDAEEFVARLNALVEELEQYPDTEIRDKALDLIQGILDLYGETLRRMLAAVDSVSLKDQLLSRLLSDEVIRAVLLIHGLLPIGLEDRVAAALDQLRPYLISQGADLELVRVEGGRAHVRLMRKGSGAPPVAALKADIEKALAEAAPDLLGIEIDGLANQPGGDAKAAASPPARLVQIKRPATVSKIEGGTWVPVVRAIGFEEGKFKIVSFDDVNLLVCKVGGEFYAYRNACASGGRALGDALYESAMLTCTCHGYHYDLRRGGACMERPDLRLESLKVKVEDDKVKVAF